MSTSPKLVLGCTTIPSRIEHIRKTLQCIEIQKVKPDVFYITVPKFSAREHKPYDVERLQQIVREELREVKGVVNVIDTDYGPLTKLVGSLLAEKDAPPDTIIVSIDDDQIYCPDFLERLKQKADQYPTDCLCMCGIAIGKFPCKYGIRYSRQTHLPLSGMYYLKEDSPVDIVLGYGGVVYRRGFFSADILNAELENHRMENPTLHKHDDHYISAWLDIQGITKRVIAYDTNTLHRYGKNPDFHGPAQTLNGLVFDQGNRVQYISKWVGLAADLKRKGLLLGNAKVPPTRSLPLLVTVGTGIVTIGIVAGIIYCSKKRGSKMGDIAGVAGVAQ